MFHDEIPTSIMEGVSIQIPQETPIITHGVPSSMFIIGHLAGIVWFAKAQSGQFDPISSIVH